jgi:hypothetical protein
MIELYNSFGCNRVLGGIGVGGGTPIAPIGHRIHDYRGMFRMKMPKPSPAVGRLHCQKGDNLIIEDCFLKGESFNIKETFWMSGIKAAVTSYASSPFVCCSLSFSRERATSTEQDGDYDITDASHSSSY